MYAVYVQIYVYTYCIRIVNIPSSWVFSEFHQHLNTSALHSHSNSVRHRLRPYLSITKIHHKVLGSLIHWRLKIDFLEENNDFSISLWRYLKDKWFLWFLLSWDFKPQPSHVKIGSLCLWFQGMSFFFASKAFALASDHPQLRHQRNGWTTLYEQKEPRMDGWKWKWRDVETVPLEAPSGRSFNEKGWLRGFAKQQKCSLDYWLLLQTPSMRDQKIS